MAHAKALRCNRRPSRADTTGVEPGCVGRLVDVGVLVPALPDRFSPGDGRRVLFTRSLEGAGAPIDGFGAAIRQGALEPGVRCALQMVDGLAGAGLPPAHVGLHAGPVLFQEGDYFGQTVNLAARIADYARPGEVLVSQQVADATTDSGFAFQEIGDVELKGVSGTVHLLRARAT